MTIERFSLQNKRALITGSTRGIGFTLAIGLAEAGARPVINGRDSQAVAEAADKIRKMGFDCDEVAFDVTDRGAVNQGVDDIESRLGPIDILVNNAGKQDRAPLETFEDENWDALMDLNVNGVFAVSRAVGRHMIERRAGKIINICSIQSALARPSIAPYTASKGAVANLTKGMCADWAKYNIQTNGLAPGYFETELTQALVEDETFNAWLCNRTPAGRWGQLDELVGAAIFLASDASSYVNGQILYIDGGMGACV